MTYLRRSTRKPALSSFMVSGETVTTKDMAERLSITTTQVQTRKRHALLRLKPGEILTWEMMMR